MKYLALLLLLITSCADKTQEYSPEEFARSLAARKNVPEPIIQEEIKSEPLEITKLSYENDLDLMLVYTRFKMWDWELSERRKDPTAFDDNGEATGYYMATYWDTNTHIYYTVMNAVINEYHSLDPVTNIQFEYTIDEQKQYEAVFHPTMKEIFRDTKAPLLYIGSITPLDRVYLDPTNQNYYIKHLTPFDISINIKNQLKNVEIADNDTNILRVFPTADPYFSPTNTYNSTLEGIYSNMPNTYSPNYTNNNGDRFDDFIRK